MSPATPPPSSDNIPTTHQKALRINLDPLYYGTFAEIGAGQEVARWFFRVGGASGTVAKTISAYDMTVSDSIYGKCERYVCRKRVLQMLDHEYSLLLKRLQAKRGRDTTFFAFANTVAARSYKGNTECHGWLGMRFQLAPHSAANEILLHVRLLDKDNYSQQEALGTLGVNLIYASFKHHHDIDTLVRSLLDNLSTERIEVDMLKVSGPDFHEVDNRLVALQLVRLRLTDAVMFDPEGELIQASEHLYNKPILLERGSFRPVTRLNLEMMACARAQYLKEPQNQGRNIVEIMEITTNNLLSSGQQLDDEDFLQRVDILCSLGKTVLVSEYAEFHRLAAFLARYSRKMAGIVVGIPLLREILDEKYYTDLAGGILEAFGRLFKHGLKVYAYPSMDQASGQIITAETLTPPPHVEHLYRHLLSNGHIATIPCRNPGLLGFSSRTVTEKIASGDHSWEQYVVTTVAEIIREKNYFGYKG